jgi:PEP-CTERM motif
MKKIIAFTVAASAMLASAIPAQALSITYTPGATFVAGNIFDEELDESFNGFPQDGFFPGGGRVRVQSAIARDPFFAGPGDKFLQVSGTTTFTFDGPRQVFSFDANSVRANTSLTLNFVNSQSNPSLTLLGSDILNLPGILPITDSGRVRYNMLGGPAVVSFVITTGNTNATSRVGIDDIASAVPEPATWGMLLLGFGFAGTALRASRRNVAA